MRRTISKKTQTGYLDTIDIEPHGVFRAWGWAGEPDAASASIWIEQQGRTIPPTHLFKSVRPDVSRTLGRRGLFGLGAEFVRTLTRDAFVLCFDGARVKISGPDAATMTAEPPPYAELLDTKTVYTREMIYGSGPPATSVNPEILEIALALPPPVLDFGCGSGALVAALRRQGVAAFGIEIDRPELVRAVLAEADPYIKHYDGSLPLPFKDKEFASVLATEVIEHVANYDGVLAEIARVASRMVALTVPDMTAIPIGYRHGVVPWHLLEATHVNFFTPASLRAALSRHFSNVRLIRIGSGMFGGDFMPVGIGAYCSFE